MLDWDPSRFTDHYTTVAGMKVRYWQAGQSGAPIVLVHGIGASVEYWVRNILPLAERYRVYALDLVGFGRSEKPRRFDYSVAHVADFIVGFLDAVGLDSVHWVANSMGGLVALSTTARHAPRTRSLALVDTAGFGRQVTWLFRLMSIPGLGELMARPTRGSLVTLMPYLFADARAIPDVWIDALEAVGREPGQRQAFLRVLRSGITPLGVRKSIRDEVAAALGTLACPTLLVWGRQDRILPFAHGLNALATVPRAQFHVWDGAGHLPMLEKAASFNRVILAWLDEVASDN